MPLEKQFLQLEPKQLQMLLRISSISDIIIILKYGNKQLSEKVQSEGCTKAAWKLFEADIAKLAGVEWRDIASAIRKTLYLIQKIKENGTSSYDCTDPKWQ